MPDYKSLFISLRHAHNMCNARVVQYSRLLSSYTEIMTHLETVQATQRLNSKDKKLGLNMNLYLKDQVEKRKVQIQETQARIDGYKSIVSEASRHAKFLLDAITVIETHSYDGFDLNQIIESIKYAVDLAELKVRLYRKSKSDCSEIIANQEKFANTQKLDATSTTKTFIYLARCHDDVRIKYVHDLEQLNIAMGIILKYNKLKENQLQTQNAECIAAGNVR